MVVVRLRTFVLWYLGLKRDKMRAGIFITLSSVLRSVLCKWEGAIWWEDESTTPIDPHVEHEEWMSWFNGLPKREYMGVHHGPVLRTRDGEEADPPVFDSFFDPFGGFHLSPNSTSPIGETYPIVLEIFGVIAGIIVLIFIIICLRRRARGSGRAALVRPQPMARNPEALVEFNIDTLDYDDGSRVPDEPWIHLPTMPVNLRDDEGWDRENIGEFITVVNARTLKLECPYNTHMGTEGAIWNYGFTRGHHKFAIMWPRDERIYYEAHVCVGVGLASDMHQDEGRPLVGGNKYSLGFSLVSKALLFDGFKVRKYPKHKPRDFCIPTLFYMYLDLEADQLSFGSEEEFWGVALNIEPIRKCGRDVPIYPMAAFKKVHGRLMLFYKGQVPESSIPSSVPTRNGVPGYDTHTEISMAMQEMYPRRLSSIMEESHSSPECDQMDMTHFMNSSRQQLYNGNASNSRDRDGVDNIIMSMGF